MGILDSILGGISGNSADGGSGSGGNTKMLLLMGLLAMIANRSGNAQAQGGQGGDLIGSLGAHSAGCWAVRRRAAVVPAVLAVCWAGCWAEDKHRSRMPPATPRRPLATWWARSADWAD